MTDMISISPELAADLEECEVGTTETLTVVVEITQNDEQGFEAKVVRADKGDSYEAEDEAETDSEVKEEVELPSKKGPAGNPALMVILGGEKPTKK